MAIQPSNRADGSEHVLRFRGVPTLDAAVSPVVRANGSFPVYAQNQRLVTRFLMADATSVTNTRRKLPSSVYDDPTPATATRPQSIELQTWAENAKVRCKEIVPAGVAAGVITYIGDMEFTWELDTLTTGLFSNTGLPVLVLSLQSAAANIGAFGSPEIVVEVTVTHSMVR